MIKHSAFSLIEILVTIVIISALAVFGHAQYITYQQRAKVNEALNLLEEYQTSAIGVRARTGAMAPYYVLFSDSDQTGLVTGTPTGDSASKTVDLKYVDDIVAYRGTSGSNNYILIGAKLQDDGIFVSGADYVYVAGVETPAGILTWSCGTSVSRANTVDSKYLPKTCQASLP